MGVFRVKACPVMFNTHHRADILKNAFEATNCKMFIFESKYLSALRDIARDLPSDTRFYMIDNASHFWFGDNIQHTNVDINQNIVKVQSDHALITRNDLIQGKPVNGTLGEVLQCTSPTPSGIKYEYSLQDHVSTNFSLAAALDGAICYQFGINTQSFTRCSCCTCSPQEPQAARSKRRR